MKTISKVLILSILLCSILTISSAETVYHNGTLSYYIDGETEDNGPGLSSTTMMTINDDLTMFHIDYDGKSTSGVPKTLRYYKVNFDHKGDWANVPSNVGGSFYLVADGAGYTGTPLGTGSMYTRKGSSEGDYIVDIYFDDNCNDLTLNSYDVWLYSSAYYTYFSYVYRNSMTGYTVPMYNNLKISFGPGGATMVTFGVFEAGTDLVVYNYEAPFNNEYSIKINGSLVLSTINRVIPGGLTESAFVLKDSLSEIVYNTGLATTNDTYYHNNGTYNYYIYTQFDNTYHLIHSNLEIPDEITNATLSLDELTYNIGDVINYEFNNLEELGDVDDTYTLQYYHYTGTETIEYVFNHKLYDGETSYSGTGSTNTTGWTPKKLYYGIINDKVNKESKVNFLSNVRLEGYVNLTYAYEFVNNTCQGSQCSYNNGDTITIAYNTITDADICIRDGTDNIIQVLNVPSGSNTISYTIPFDDNKMYTYPGWKITMNSYYDNLVVYWIEESEYTEYVADTTYVDQETVEENLLTLKDSIDPIKELVIGFGSIIIENPDYDENGIVSGDEMDQWFNAIIGILIIVVIYIFYKGLSER